MSALLEKIPPQSLEAEQSVLGSMLIDKEAIAKAMEILRDEDFHTEANRTVFKLICDLFDAGAAVDVITVAEKARQKGALDDIGGVQYITTLTNVVPTAANIEHYARIVEEKSILRKLISTATHIVAMGFAAREDVATILDHAQRQILDISLHRSVQGYAVLKDVLIDTLERIEFLYANKGSATGVASGFSDLDTMTTGFQPSDLVIVAARPSVGKSSFALAISRHAAVDDKVPVGMFSLEMAKEQLAQRILCAEAGIDGQRLRNGYLQDADWKKLSEALGRLGEAPVYIDDAPNASLMEVRTKARRMKAEHNIGLMVIDYLQLMHMGGKYENRQQEIATISRSLKALARELSIPIVALSQLSRQVEHREGKRPVLSDLRESGALEQDADVVIFLHNTEEAENVLEIVVAKQRNGPTGSVKLYFQKNIGRFHPLEKGAEAG
jgi:replicative DNA helicase